MRAYKFLSAEWAIKDLEQRKLKVSLFPDMNDPFELLGFELSNTAHRDAFRALRIHAEQTQGVLCFSRGWNNPVLWSHYADKHRGICLGFDLADDWINEVNYSSSRLRCELKAVLATRSGEEELIRRLYCTKFQDWRYEDEVRVLVPLKEKDGPHYFVHFGADVRLREVVFGPRSTSEHKAALRHALNDYAEDIEVVHSRLAFKSFKVVRDRRFAPNAKSRSRITACPKCHPLISPKPASDR